MSDTEILNMLEEKDKPCDCFFATIISLEYGLWDCPFPSCIFKEAEE